MATKRAGANPSDENEEGIGHGKLYSPAFAIKMENNTHKQEKGDNGSRPSLSSSSLVKLREMLLQKLVTASAPPIALNKAHDLLDATFAHVNEDTLLNDIAALSRIVKDRLVDAVPNLSSDVIKKVVDDAMKELKLDSVKDGKDSQQYKKDLHKESMPNVKSRL